MCLGKDEVRMQLDSALQDVNTRYTELEETEKKAVCRALIEERGRFCSFVTMLKPVLVSSCSLSYSHTATTLDTSAKLSKTIFMQYNTICIIRWYVGFFFEREIARESLQWQEKLSEPFGITHIYV